MFKRLLVILLLHLLLQVSFAQPNIAWWRTYDAGGVRNEHLADIYRVFNGGYIACGGSNYRVWIIRVDDDGELIWSSILDAGRANSIIETDDGDFVLGCTIDDDRGQSQFGAIRINPEGELVWQEVYCFGGCHSVIELKSGEFLLSGTFTEGNRREGHIRMIESDGQTIWSQIYGQQPASFRGMRETNGGVVLTGPNNGAGWDRRWCCLKVDFNGEVIWTNIYESDIGNTPHSIESTLDNGFLIAGSWYNFDDYHHYHVAVLKIEDNGGAAWHHRYPIEGMNENCRCVCRTPEQDFILVGQSGSSSRHVVYRINPGGEVRWRQLLDFDDGVEYAVSSNSLKSVINGHNNAILASGTILLRDNQRRSDGLIVKLEPEILGPYFIAWSPEDTVFTTLLGDTVAFSVEAVNQQGDELSYAWYYADTLRGQNTEFEMVFDSLGVFEVQCRASDAEFTAAITWHITVDDFFIRQILPDSLQMIVRRGSTLPFTIDVACVEPDAPTIEWSTVNRDNDHEYLGEADSIDVTFDLAGEWAVEAEAIWGEERESVRWAVDVRSAVWWWMPHEEAISVNQHERRDFSVFPFDPDSDSLSVAWWFDGESLDCAAEALSLDFPDLGEHSLMTIVRDGVEADTIHWQIIVNDPGGVFDRNAIPTELALYPPAPNPFNSTTTISYSLPAAGAVSLTVYDLSGREVARLADGVMQAGTHEAVWVADGVSSGVYVVCLDAGGVPMREKVVLVK